MKVGTTPPSPDEEGRILINVDVSPETLAMLEQLVDEGHFKSVSDAFRAGIDLLERDPDVLMAKMKKLIEQVNRLTGDSQERAADHDESQPEA